MNLLHALLRGLTVAGALTAVLTAGAAQIVVGQVAPLSGPEANQGRAYATGLKLALTRANTSGASGHTFTLVSKDDGGRAADTLAATRQMLKENRPLVLAGYLGGHGTGELIGTGLLEKERIALVGYRAAEILPESPMVFSVRASLRDEMAKIVEHLQTVGISRIGLFLQDGPSAERLMAVAEEIMKERNAQLSVKKTYPAGTAQVSDAVVDAFLAAKPQAIVMIASGSASATFIERYRMEKGAAQLYTHSGADVEQLAQRLGEEQLKGVAITQVTPNPYKVSGRLVKEFNEMATKSRLDVPISYAMMEGYIAGTVIVEAAQRMGGQATREGFMAALNRIDDFDMGGYTIGFKPGMRVGSRFVELTIVSAVGRIRQ